MESFRAILLLCLVSAAAAQMFDPRPFQENDGVATQFPGMRLPIPTEEGDEEPPKPDCWRTYLHAQNSITPSTEAAVGTAAIRFQRVSDLENSITLDLFFDAGRLGQTFQHAEILDTQPTAPAPTAIIRTKNNVTGIHLHEGGVNQEGPVVAGFCFNRTTCDGANDGEWTSTISCDQTCMNALMSGRAYVNIHSEEIPAGALRGQMRGPVMATEEECVASSAGRVAVAFVSVAVACAVALLM